MTDTIFLTFGILLILVGMITLAHGAGKIMDKWEHYREIRRIVRRDARRR